ncbi:MAG: acyl carrier protein [Aureliella sp.]
MDAIESILLEKLAAMFGGQPKLSDSLLLLGVDSVGMAELTFDIEKQFGIRVDDAILDVDTVADLAAYVRQKQAGSSASTH